MAKTFQTLPRPDVPKEQVGNVVFGTFGHLGSPVAYAICLILIGVTAWSSLLLFIGVSAVFLTFTLWAEARNPSVDLPKATGKEFFDGLVMVFIKGVGVGGGLVTLGWWALSFVPLYGEFYNTWWLILAATLATDLAYYWIHRLLSHSRGHQPILKYYRKKHAAHHSVTELDFMRGNQSSLVDTAVSQFQPSLIIISWLFGMDLGSTLAAYGFVLMLQATDHTNITFNIGWLNWIFMDNHAHKLHHCKRGNLVNHAAAFAFWDRIWGTYYEDWELSSNYLHHHRIALPIKRIPPQKKASRKPPVVSEAT